MSFSLEDFLKVSEDQEKKRTAAREEERARDQAVRASERSADLKQIEILIKSGVKDEVSEAIKPITVQQKQFEQETNNKIENLEANLSELKTLLKAGTQAQQHVTYAQHVTHAQHVAQPQHGTRQEQRDPVQQAVPLPTNEISKVKTAVMAAKKIISLQPI